MGVVARQVVVGAEAEAAKTISKVDIEKYLEPRDSSAVHLAHNE